MAKSCGNAICECRLNHKDWLPFRAEPVNLNYGLKINIKRVISVETLQGWKKLKNSFILRPEFTDSGYEPSEMNESIIIALIQNIALLMAFAMLYENFWLRNDKPRSLISKIFSGLILGGIGSVLMFTPWTMIPGMVFDTRSVMLAISGVFFGFVPTIIAMTIVATVRFFMGGAGVWMGIAVILSSGAIGMIWAQLRKDRQQKKRAVEFLLLGLTVHIAMLASTVFLPEERIVPTLQKIFIPVFLIYIPGTVLLGLLMTAQKRNFLNRIERKKLYETEHKLSRDLIENQKELQFQLEKYSKLNKQYLEQNAELQNAKEKAEESDRLKTAFLANLSHEIRTPMNAIMGFADLLEVDELSDELRDEYTQIIKKSGAYLLSIINDIIEISHIESGQLELKLTEVDPVIFMDELYGTMKLSQPAIDKVEFRLQKHQDKMPSKILTDEVKLKQILINLLNNAFKFTQEGEISVGCYLPDDSRISFYVKDTGTGIDEKNQQIIFERFRQAEGKNVKVQGGSGLGLAIVKAYTDLLDGSVHLQSEPEKGSVFTVTFPLIIPDVEIRDRKTIAASQRIKTGENLILVAEDEDINWFLLNQILSVKNFKLIRAVNGREAVELCRKNDNIELVLMDIKMPEMNGYEAREEIRRFKPALPVIAQTAYALPSDVERLKSSFSDYITKPINRHLLIEKIAAVWQNYNNSEEFVQN
jgi:signal transduction histidine kinase/CheY-like chemotaxis protein